MDAHDRIPDPFSDFTVPQDADVVSAPMPPDDDRPLDDDVIGEEDPVPDEERPVPIDDPAEPGSDPTDE